MARLWWQGWDPGADGAAALLSPGRRLIVLWCWRKFTERKLPVYDVAICQGSGGRVERVQSLCQVGEVVRDGTLRVTGCTTYGIACEETFVHNNVNTTLKIARSQGKLVGPGQNHAPGRVVWFVRPPEWRKTAFPKGYRKMVKPIGVPKGTKPKPKHYDKAASLKFVPPAFPPLALMLQRAGVRLRTPWHKLSHGAEAVAVANHGWVNEGR